MLAESRISITGPNQWTDWIAADQFTILIAGTFVATIRSQVKRPDDPDSAAIDLELAGVKTWTAPAVLPAQLGSALMVRAGVADSDYTSGTAEVTVRSAGAGRAALLR